MTFNTYETSRQDGSPVELYDFSIGFTHYRYTSADRDLVFSGETFVKETLERTEFEETDDLARANITVTVPRTFPVAEEFRVAPPSYPILLNVWRIHVGDTERKLVWAGRVLNATWEGVSASLHCESILTSMQRPGLRRLYQRQCPHVLYGNACGVSDVANRVVSAVFTASGTVVTVTAGDVSSVGGDGYFDGGFVEAEVSPGVYGRRAIKTQVGDVLTLTHPIPGLTVGAVVDVYPGCDHTLATCHAKFANSANYGGFPYVPRKNPFGGQGL